MTKHKFAAFILTHGRPNEVVTYDTLRNSGYTGDIYIIIDNEDSTADQYYKKYGRDRVIMFDKAAIAERIDVADTIDDRRAVVFARNASFDIARQLGLDYFIQFDDDNNFLKYRYPNGEGVGSHDVRQLDRIFPLMIDFMEASNAASIAWAQGGDYMGGSESSAIRKPLLRKAMNSWLCRTDRPVKFVGRLNDDVNTYTVYGMRGELFFTITRLHLNQNPTQQTEGGMTEMYLNAGTYAKSMYSVIMAPSCVRVITMGRTNRRLHHQVRWDNAVPKIISDTYRKHR